MTDPAPTIALLSNPVNWAIGFVLLVLVAFAVGEPARNPWAQADAEAAGDRSRPMKPTGCRSAVKTACVLISLIAGIGAVAVWRLAPGTALFLAVVYVVSTIIAIRSAVRYFAGEPVRVFGPAARQPRWKVWTIAVFYTVLLVGMPAAVAVVMVIMW